MLLSQTRDHSLQVRVFLVPISANKSFIVYVGIYLHRINSLLICKLISKEVCVSTSSHLGEMEVRSNLPSHNPYLFDYIEPTLHVSSADYTESLWQPAFLHGLEPQMDISVPVIKPSGPGFGSEAQSRTGSPRSGLLHDVINQDLLYQSMIKEKIKPLASSSRPLSCHPYIKKCSKRGWAPLINQVLKGEVEHLLSGSLTDIFSDVKEPMHFQETIPSQMYPANRLTGVASPTSIIVEDQIFQSSSSIQSSGDGELIYPCVKFPIKKTSNSHACSDGSISSEVAGPAEICHFDKLMGSLSNQSNAMNYVTQSFEAWFSESAEDPSSCKATFQTCYTNGRKVNDGPEIGPLVDRKGENLLHAKVHDELEAVVSQGLIGCTQSQQAKCGLGLQNERGELLEQHIFGLEEILLHPHQQAKIFNEGSTTFDCNQIFLPGPNLGPYHENNVQNQHTMHDDFIACSATHTSVADSKHLGRYKELDRVYESSSLKRSSSYIGEGINAPQISKVVKIDDTLDAYIDKTLPSESNPSLAFRHIGVRFGNDYSEMGLVHLLTAGAEAVARRDMDLASVILVRLKDLISCSGNTVQRVAAYFTHGLQHQIEGGAKGNDHAGNIKSQSDILAAFQILHEISPYIKFGHFTANQAILEAVQGEKRVHIVDFEIMEGIQWPAFMQALVSRKGGPPELHITALCRPHLEHGLAMVQKTGKRLSEFASTLKLPFTFSLLKVGSKEEFNAFNLKLVKGEALVVNCMLHLPHMPRQPTTSVTSFLQGMRKLSPIVLTVVEEELGCSTTAFASYFFEALHHYYAICDSLEACLPTEIMACMLVERVFMAPRIDSAVALWNRLSYPNLEHRTDGSGKYKWSTLVHSAGFKPLPISFHNLSQAKLLLGLHKDGFKIEERSHCLVLGWQSKPLFAASVWN